MKKGESVILEISPKYYSSWDYSISRVNSAVPVVSASGNNVYVDWADGATSETLLRRSTDNGASTGPELKFYIEGVQIMGLLLRVQLI